MLPGIRERVAKRETDRERVKRMFVRMYLENWISPSCDSTNKEITKGQSRTSIQDQKRLAEMQANDFRSARRPE